MIIKPCVKSIHLEKLEALERRISQNHPSRSLIEADYAKRLSGFRGEQSLEYHLSFLPDNEVYLLHNLRLSENNRYFQMDTLLIFASVIIIIEVKNFRSMLTFDQKGKQLIQTIEESEKGYPCPLIQVSRHKFQLHNWLNSFKINNIPIETLVVITNPSTILRTIPQNAPLPKNVIRNTMLAEKINSIKKEYLQELLSIKDSKKLSRLLIKNHTPYDIDILEHYQIGEDDIQTGVFCPKCRTLSMIWKRGSWHCISCTFNSKDAHIAAIKDYSLLIGSTITNHQSRSFLHIPSDTTAKKLLQSMKLPYSGTNKARKYILSQP